MVIADGTQSQGVEIPVTTGELPNQEVPSTVPERDLSDIRPPEVAKPPVKVPVSSEPSDVNLTAALGDLDRAAASGQAYKEENAGISEPLTIAGDDAPAKIKASLEEEDKHEGLEAIVSPDDSPEPVKPPVVAAPPEPVPVAPPVGEPAPPVGAPVAEPTQLVVDNNPWATKTDLAYEIPTGPDDPPRLAKPPVPTEVPYPKPEPWSMPAPKKPEVAPDAAEAITADTAERKPEDIIRENSDKLLSDRDAIYEEIFDLRKQVLETVNFPQSQDRTQRRLNLEREISEKHALAELKTQEIRILLNNILIYSGRYKMPEEGLATGGGGK